ncbi:MAG: Hint domain-containing protein [Pseudomonadota bacterium]
MRGYPRNQTGAGPLAKASFGDHAVASEPAPQRQALPIRRYEIQWLTEAGDVMEATKVAPATPVYEESSAAFAHGSLIDTIEGPVSVEDLRPGMKIQTRDCGYVPLLWTGSITLVPQQHGSPVTDARLTRITEGSMGLGRPSQDLLLGPYARVLRRNPALLASLGTDTAFVPASTITDGTNVIEVTPFSPVRVFHLLVEGQQVLTANGVEVESYHPGRQDSFAAKAHLKQNLLSLFPQASSLADFGTMRVPRLTPDDYSDLDDA